MQHRTSSSHSSSTSSAASGRGGARDLDFDAEAHALWKRLNLDPTARQVGRWNALDSIYKHPHGGGTIYVGNQTAAESLSMLK
jgi:hypothetical protein